MDFLFAPSHRFLLLVLQDLLSATQPTPATSTEDQNELSVAFMTMLEDLDAELNYLTAVNWMGALQVAGGVDGAAVGAPNMAEHSPSSVFQDAVHPNVVGYTALYNVVYDAVFADSPEVPSCAEW